MKVKSYKELIVWQKSMDLVEEIYSATRTFPKEEILRSYKSAQTCERVHRLEHR